MTEHHVCFFEPMFAECKCGRRLTIAELCQRASATEMLSAEDAEGIGLLGFAQATVLNADKILAKKYADKLAAYANILDGKDA